ncbi:hypothetical protein N9U09_00395 [bacterium]|nr:hypothetical protein [bacterium]
MYISVWTLLFPAIALADNHEGENELPIPAIATLVILGNVIQYFRQVTRKRYKVKE